MNKRNNESLGGAAAASLLLLQVSRESAKPLWRMARGYQRDMKEERECHTRHQYIQRMFVKVINNLVQLEENR